MRASIVLVVSAIMASAPLHSAAVPPQSGPMISKAPQPQNPCPPGSHLREDTPYRPEGPNVRDCVADDGSQNPPGGTVDEAVTTMFMLLATDARTSQEAADNCSGSSAIYDPKGGPPIELESP